MPNRDDPIIKIQAVIDEYEKDKFSPEEKAILHQMIDLWEAFQVLGKVANVARNVFIWLAGFALLWFFPLEETIKIVKKYFGIG